MDKEMKTVVHKKTLLKSMLHVSVTGDTHLVITFGIKNSVKRHTINAVFESERYNIVCPICISLNLNCSNRTADHKLHLC